MRKEDFFELLGDLDDDIVTGTEAAVRKKPNWRVWGAIAACLCLTVATSAILRQSPAPGGISTPGTVVGADGGVEGMMYSVAVYPASESEENVASADITSLTENEALSHALAEHLPAQLPEAFHYGRGSIYNTIMKDGTQYNMLRVEYITGTIPEQRFTEDGGAVAPAPETIGDLFTVCVLNYEPKTDISVYSSAEEVPLSALEERGAVYIRSGGCYIGVFTETADPASVLTALKYIE